MLFACMRLVHLLNQWVRAFQLVAPKFFNQKKTLVVNCYSPSIVNVYDVIRPTTVPDLDNFHNLKASHLKQT